VDLRAVGGPAASAHRDSNTSVDMHVGKVTNGCFGATKAELNDLVDRLAGTSEGTLTERIRLANDKLRKERVLLRYSRDLTPAVSTSPVP
jgi:hypothetical protein